VGYLHSNSSFHSVQGIWENLDRHTGASLWWANLIGCLAVHKSKGHWDIYAQAQFWGRIFPILRIYRYFDILLFGLLGVHLFEKGVGSSW